jgi:hypothetical protein
LILLTHVSEKKKEMVENYCKVISFPLPWKQESNIQTLPVEIKPEDE